VLPKIRFHTLIEVDLLKRADVQRISANLNELISSKKLSSEQFIIIPDFTQEYFS
jgi:hypothetical protein